MKYERIKIEDLTRAKYNRSIDTRRAKKIAAFYNEHLFDPIVVGRHGSDYSIIDGQHRVFAAKLLGLDSIMCKIIDDIDYAKEAELFTEYNGKQTRKPLDAFELYKGRFESGEDAAVRMSKIAEMFGFVITNQVGDNKIACVSIMNSIITRYGPDAMATTLAVVKSAWAGDKDSLRGFILEGVCILISHCKGIDNARLSAKLKAATPLKLLAEADNDPNGGKKSVRVARQMLRYYNKSIGLEKRVKDTL